MLPERTADQVTQFVCTRVLDRHAAELPLHQRQKVRCLTHQLRSAARLVFPATLKQAVPARCRRPRHSLRGPQPRTSVGRPSSQLPARWWRQGKTRYVNLTGLSMCVKPTLRDANPPALRES